ncbi:MAG: CHRD domain-containing protein [Thermodesulfobacteriota bacterium]
MSKNMKSILVSIVGLCSLCGFVSGMALSAEGTAFHCSLGVDGRAMAKGEFGLSEDGTALQFKLVVHKVEDITMAHLHLGKAGKIGTPVAWLYPGTPPPKLLPGLFDGVLAQGTLTGADLMGPLRGKPLSSLITEIRRGNVYVNIHTRTHGRGDICGPVHLTEE